MIREQLVLKFAKNENLEPEMAAQFIESFFSTLKLGLSRNEKVSLPKFGSFEGAVIKSRLMKNKTTGEMETVPQTITPHFTSSRPSKSINRPKPSIVKPAVTGKKTQPSSDHIKILDIKEAKVETPELKEGLVFKKIIILFIVFTILNLALFSIIGIQFMKSKYVKHYFNNTTQKYLNEKGLTHEGITEIVDTKFQQVLDRTEEYNKEVVSSLKDQLLTMKKSQEKSLKKLQTMEGILKKRIEKMIAPSLKKRNKTAEVQLILYTIKKNDTLWALSEKYMKNPYNWVGLYQTNGKKIKDPNLIYPGQKIFIPLIKEK
ncbi:MAG: HU family DNA-binding protein [Spirochaetes bacterium]|nr:HU family DNA-binding protein [Spirochaetota bacterium]